MTKAFTPQGLLSAGLQDKQDRSAKRQEELARESGASLINVPNKPPPPQVGLLGAITAHERERNREGGVGAALTEREREKRVAEERQRKLDEFQRQQLDQMQQGGGSMFNQQQQQQQFGPMSPMMTGMNPYGYQGYPMNPMMTGMNPMMTGMNPMMTGMNPMMTGGMYGYNPQHMFAAQQAAQAYQQAMMAFSTAGSQIGGEGGDKSPNMATQALNPMSEYRILIFVLPSSLYVLLVTGGSMYDPRMSMMGMPMMGMGSPMQPMQQLPQLPQMGPMGQTQMGQPGQMGQAGSMGPMSPMGPMGQGSISTHPFQSPGPNMMQLGENGPSRSNNASTSRLSPAPEQQGQRGASPANRS